MSFRDMVRADNQRVFTNLLEFARPTTIVFDGDRWDDVPCVLTQVRAKDRQAGQSDHAQGIYLVSANAYFDVTQTGGAIPEKGSRIKGLRRGRRPSRDGTPLRTTRSAKARSCRTSTAMST